MSDKDNTSDNSGSGKKTLTLKGAPNVGAKPGMSRSSRTVVVEKRTRRVGAPGAGAPQSAPGGGRPQGGQRPGGRPQSGSPRSNAAPTGTLTQSEAQARERALREAAARADEDKRKAEEEARRLAEIDARRKAEREEAERKAAEDAARQAEQEAEPAAQAKDDLDEIVPVKAGQARPKPAHRPSPKAAQPDMPPPPPPGEGEDDRIRRRAAPTPKALVDRDELERAKRSAAPKPSTQPSRRDGNSRGRLNVNSALADNDGDRGRSLASMRRRQNKKMGKVAKAAQPKISREVTLPEAITVAELANRMSERAVDVIKLLMGQGQMLKINDVIDADTAELVATELGHTVKRVSDSDVEEGLFEEIGDSDEADLAPRPAVVTIMGHVDHGKTSLLDAIREAKVVDTEAGGITQHIGAYQVEKNGQKITFLDTPGHEAFTAMRARGAQATDIAVLVVAADDSVMPQTIESIKHAKAAGVPLIVAINKIDKPGADANKVRTELLQHEVFVESMGGEVLDVEVSALKKTNLDGLLEAILLQAEVAELKAPEKGNAQGLVIESKLDKGRGAVATVLVQRGTLNVGDILVAGTEWAKVRALIDDKGRQVKSAGPSTPVEVLGFSGVPDAGDRFAVVENEARAREITEYRQRTIREKTAGGGATSLEQMMQQLKDSDISKVPLVIKGDVQGSVEAIVTALNKLSTDEVSAQILYSGVGGITESDVTLATASKAVIIGFNVRANKQAAELASREGIEIRYYNVIYDLIDDVKNAMSGMLEPEVRETFIGYAEILEVFNISKVGKVAGCRVTEGTVERGAGVRLLRDNVVIHEGKLSTLKRFKDEVKDVPAGQECGMAFERYEDMRPGDVIECYRVEKVQRTL